MSTCARCGEENPDRARFCLACGMALRSGVAQSRKVITVLFADMVDSTGLGEKLDPETMRNVMTLYFEVVRATIERHGGTVEKFIGDAVVAVFGIPAVHEDDAFRAVRTAIDMQRAIADLAGELEERLGRPLQIRIGIDTGEVIAGTDLDDATGVVGDPLNSAARLEKLARPGGIVVGAATHRLIQRSTTATPLGEVELRGLSEPVAAYAIEDVDTEGETRGLDTPLVGRTRELDALERTFERVVGDRSSSLFTLLGAAGVGKSRLVREFLEGVESRARVLTGRCLPYGDGITFWPVMETVFEAAEISDRDSQEDALDKILGLLGEHEDAKAITNLVGEVLGLGQRNAGQEEIFWAVRLLFETLARDDPLVVVFDDIHWAEETFLDLLDHLTEWTTDAPLLILCLARQDLLEQRPTWGGGKLNSTTMLIDALRDEEAQELFIHLLGGDVTEVNAQMAPVLEAAGGNPLFLEETIAMLVEDGTLQQIESRWTATKDIAAITIPPTIQGLLAARLEQLPTAGRAAVEAAAVTGKVFSAQSVAQLLSDDEETKRVLPSLERKGLIRRDASSDFAGEEMYRFRHILIRDAAYNGIPKERRAALHEQYADWLIEVMGERVTEYEEVIGYHFEQANRYAVELGLEGDKAAIRAAEHLSAAGRRALSRSDLRAASSLLNRALALLPAVGPGRADILIDLAEVLMEQGEYEACSRICLEAISVARDTADRRAEARGRLQLEESYIHSDPTRTAEQFGAVARQAIETFTELGDDLGLAFANRLLSYAYESLGDSARAQSALKRAVDHAAAGGDEGREIAYRRAHIQSISWGPISIAELEAQAKDFLEWTTALGDRRSRAVGLGIMATVQAANGRLEEGRRLIEEQRAIYDDMGLDKIRAWGVFDHVATELWAGDIVDAEAELLKSAQFLRLKGERAVLPTLLSFLADIRVRQGRVDEAQDLADEALGLGASDDIITIIKCRSVQALVAAAKGREEEAMHLANQAVQLAEGTDYLDWRAFAWLDLADVTERLGRRAEMEAALQTAIDLFEKKGLNARAERARARLVASREATTG